MLFRSLTDIAISFPMRVKVLAIADQRFIFRALRNSNARPIPTKIKKPCAFMQMQFISLIFVGYFVARHHNKSGDAQEDYCLEAVPQYSGHGC